MDALIIAAGYGSRLAELSPSKPLTPVCGVPLIEIGVRQAMLAQRLEDENIHVGPSDYVPWQKDNKLCFLRLEGNQWGNVPMNLELRLSVEDSPNSAACVMDAIRCCKVALERGEGGALIGPSAYFCKHPPQQFNDDVAAQMVEEYVGVTALAAE